MSIATIYRVIAKPQRISHGVAWAALCCLAASSWCRADAPAEGDWRKIDLTVAEASAAWAFEDRTARIGGGELVLDGRRQMVRAFYKPTEWQDVRLRASFLVEPQEEGVLACGFVVRAVDAAHYYYVHFDRQQAILVRADEKNSWNEISRVSNLDKPAGNWQTAELAAKGNVLSVSLNGKVLFEAKDAANDKDRARGRIGFYASQGLARVKEIAVAGQALVPEREITFPPQDYITVCDDAGAGGYEAFPDVCRLADGRLMTVMYAGYGHVSLPSDKLPKGGRICFCTSRDEGRTWTKARSLYDGPDDDRDPSIVQLPGGRLLCNFFSLRKTDKPGESFRGLGTWLTTSDDAGETWSPAVQISANYYCSSPIRRLAGGRLVLGLYADKNGKSHGAVIFCDDGGKTWGREVDIDNGGVQLDAETDLIELNDGTLYAAQRPAMAQSTSRDGGATWSVAKSIGFAGHCPYLLRTKDDIILLAHRLPGTSLHYSLDECRTWSANVPIDTVIGAYPSLVNLSDGSVLVVYYEEGPGSNIRARRLRATREGIEWLRLD